MTTLIERLRNPMDGWTGDASCVDEETAAEAADRIEALEAALRQQRGWVQHWTADAEAGLKPSITALVTAVADIEATLEGEQP